MTRQRYHRRDLGTPRQFRNALVYVTMNYRKHARSEAERVRRARRVDGLSSGLWLDGWKDERIIEEQRRVRAASGARPSPRSPG